MILDRHGTLTVGKTLEEAFNRLERIEHSAKVTAIARQIGNISPLPKEEVDRLIEIADEMGVRSGKVECTSCNACRSSTTNDKPPSGRSLDDIVKEMVLKELNDKR
jgi:L-fuculose-phosphate aldolase